MPPSCGSWRRSPEKPHTNEVGELVITEPMPSMPLYLWGDETGERYRESYFESFPGTWRHGVHRSRSRSVGLPAQPTSGMDESQQIR